MRGFGLMAAAVVGLVLAVSVPARAESAGRDAEEAGKAKAKAARQKDGAARESAKASEAAAASQPSKPASPTALDTLVVPAGPDHPGFTMVGESVTYDDPTFVPYKLREAARRARANADLASIP